MEDQSNQQQVPPQPEVSFPQPREAEGKSKNFKIIIAVVGVILIVVIGGWLILGNNSGEGGQPSPTPAESGLSNFPTPALTQTPTPTPSASAAPVDKTSIKIEVLNGTGVPGEASFLEKELSELGYEDTTASNADDQSQTETVATYSRELSAVVADEITARLEELYEKVRTRRATISGGFDLSITTGPRKTASASPKATSTSKATVTPTATPKATN